MEEYLARGGVSSTYVQNEISKLINGAPEDYNTLKKIADWIVEQEDLNGRIDGLEDEIGSVDGKIAELQKTADKVSQVYVSDSNASNVDLDLVDTSGNVVARFANGSVETKAFRGYKYIEFQKSGMTTNQSVTVTVNQNFKRGDRIVLHTDRGSYPYNTPWNAGVMVTYYEDNRPIISDARIDISYIEHTITADTSSISVEYNGTLPSGKQTVTLHVYLLGDIPITPEIIRVKTDGTGNFTSLRDAVDSIGLKADDYIHPYVIEVYPGTYDVLADYDDTEINTSISSFTDVSFVGLKLLNGVSLKGIGNPDNIILTASLPTTDYTANVRGGISTINKQGCGSIENVTIISHNLRYCVHDDFGSQYAKRIKRTYRNCIFRAYNSAYTPDTSYGAGMPVGGMDAEFINCDFGENGGMHLNSQLTSFVTIRLENCKGLGFRIGDNTTAINETISEYIFDNCDFENLNYSMAGSVPHIRLRGSGNKPMLINAPASVMYALDSVIPVPITRLNANVGDVVEWYAVNIHGPRYQAATSVDKACGIVVYKDESDVYIQKAGYVRTDRVGLISFNLNDYIGLSNGVPVVVQNADDAFGRIKFIDSDNNGYVFLNWR